MKSFICVLLRAAIANVLHLPGRAIPATVADYLCCSAAKRPFGPERRIAVEFGRCSRVESRRGNMPHLDTGNTGFMLLCSSLVMLMTPGLAFFYGGLVGRRNVLAIMIQSFVSLCWPTVIWYVCGYSLCFPGDVGGVTGNRDLACLRFVH